jgi:hypothetical protein
VTAAVLRDTIKGTLVLVFRTLQLLGVCGSNLGGGESFRAVQTDPEAHPDSCTMGTGSFPGVKRSQCTADHSSPSSAEVANW